MGYGNLGRLYRHSSAHAHEPILCRCRSFGLSHGKIRSPRRCGSGGKIFWDRLHRRALREALPARLTPSHAALGMAAIAAEYHRRTGRRRNCCEPAAGADSRTRRCWANLKGVEVQAGGRAHPFHILVVVDTHHQAAAHADNREHRCQFFQPEVHYADFCFREAKGCFDDGLEI